MWPGMKQCIFELIMKGGTLLKYYTGHYQKEVFEKSTKTYSCCTDRQSSWFYLSVNGPQHIVILSCVWLFSLSDFTRIHSEGIQLHTFCPVLNDAMCLFPLALLLTRWREGRNLPACVATPQQPWEQMKSQLTGRLDVCGGPMTEAAAGPRLQLPEARYPFHLHRRHMLWEH